VSTGNLDLGQIISQSWEIYKVHWGMSILAYFIMAMLGWGFGMVSGMITQPIIMMSPEPVVVFGVQVASFVVQQIFGVWQSLCLALFYLQVVRGRGADLAVLFQGHRYLLQGAVAWLVFLLTMFAVLVVLVGIPAGITWLVTQNGEVAALVAVVGGVISLVPIIYISLAWSQMYYLIVDRNASALESLTTSHQITRGKKGTLFLIYFVLGVIGMSGIIALCIGVFATIPISILGMAVTYFHLIGPEHQEKESGTF